MAVTAVHEVWTGDDASWNSTSSGRGSSSVKRKFLVTVDNANSPDRSPDVLASTQLPQKGDQHPYSIFYRCRGVTATRVSPILFEAVANYETGSSDPTSSPLDEPATRDFDTAIEVGEIDETIDGEPIVTATGERIRGVQMPFADLSATISKNIAVFNPLIIYVFSNTVNSATFMGFPPGVVRCSRISASEVESDDFSYWRLNCEFQFRYPVNTTNDKAWYARVRHEGFKYFDNATDKNILTAREEATGAPLLSPIMLKLDGTRETDPDIGHWKEFKVHRLSDLNALGLGV